MINKTKELIDIRDKAREAYDAAWDSTCEARDSAWYDAHKARENFVSACDSYDATSVVRDVGWNTICETHETYNIAWDNARNVRDAAYHSVRGYWAVYEAARDAVYDATKS